MFTHERPTGATPRHARRTTLRRGGLVGLGATALLALSTVPAAADTPTAWDDVPDVSALGFLLLLVILPVGLALVIALLTVLPSLARDKGFEPGATWRGDPEWFGAPSKGVRAADDLSPQQIEAGSKGSGGTSGSW